VSDPHAQPWEASDRAPSRTLGPQRGQQVLYIPGRIVHHAAATYRGDGKTDAKDARIIPDQARMRLDLQPVRSGDQISTDLRLLTSRRTDLVCDRVRAINRLRAIMLEYFPALGQRSTIPRRLR